MRDFLIFIAAPVLLALAVVVMAKEAEDRHKVNAARQECLETLDYLCIRAVECGWVPTIEGCQAKMRLRHFCDSTLNQQVTPAQHHFCREDALDTRPEACEEGLPTSCSTLPGIEIRN